MDAKDQRHAQKAEQIQIEVIEQQNPGPKKQTSLQCSTCEIVRHTRIRCSKTYESNI